MTERPRPRRSFLLDLPPGPAGRPRVLCLPFAGGGCASYLPWRSAQPRLDIQPVRLPGRESRLLEPPFSSPDALIDALLAELGSPQVSLFGHSMGALLAVALAERLQRTGQPPRRVIVSGRVAPGLGTVPDPSMMTDEDVTEYLRMIGGTPSAILDDPEAMRLFAPAIRSDLQLCRTLMSRPTSTLACPVSVFRGLSDGPEDLYAGWHDVSDSVTIHAFAGDHFFPFRTSQAEVLDLIATQVLGDR